MENDIRIKNDIERLINSPQMDSIIDKLIQKESEISISDNTSIEDILVKDEFKEAMTDTILLVKQLKMKNKL